MESPLLTSEVGLGDVNIEAADAADSDNKQLQAMSSVTTPPLAAEIKAGAHDPLLAPGKATPNDLAPPPLPHKRQKRDAAAAAGSPGGDPQPTPKEARPYFLCPPLVLQPRPAYQPLPPASPPMRTIASSSSSSPSVPSTPTKRTEHFNSLPSEIMLEVFRHLPLIDMFRCRRVCPLWHHLLCDPRTLALAHQHEEQDGRPDLLVAREEELQKMYAEQQVKYQLTIGDYLQWQADLKPAMRPMLVDWLVELCTMFCFPQDTLFLAVRFLDMYLTRRRVDLDNLQLVGVTCLWLAAKVSFEDVPSATEVAATTKNTYSQQQVLDMEREVAVVLGFRLLPVTPFDYLSLLAHLVRPQVSVVQRQCRQVAPKGSRGARRDLLPALASEAATNVERAVRFNNWAKQMRASNAPFTAVAQYTIELALHEYAFAATQPSLLASGALLISLSVCMGISHHSSVLEAVTAGCLPKASSPEVTQVIKMLVHLLSHVQHHLFPAIHTKYAALFVPSPL